MSGGGNSRVPVPGGINRASIGFSRFCAALAISTSWSAFSLWLALPWVEELGQIVGLPVAWAVIFGIAIAPGFMNALQTASLLMRPDGKRLAPETYPPLTLLWQAEISVMLGLLTWGMARPFPHGRSA